VADNPRRPTPYEKFVAAMKQVLSVPKEELQRRERAWQKMRERKRKRA